MLECTQHAPIAIPSHSLLESLPIVKFAEGVKWRLEAKKDRSAAPLLILKKSKKQVLQLSSAVPNALQFMSSLMTQAVAKELPEDEFKAKKAIFLTVQCSVFVWALGVPFRSA